MTLRAILEVFIASLVGTFILTAIAIAFDRARRKPTSANVIEPSRAAFVTGVVIFIVPFAAAVATLFFPAAPPWVTVLFGALSLPTALMAVSSRRFRIELTSSGLRVRGRFRGEFEIPWAEISSIRWGIYRQAFVLRTQSGRKIVVEATMRGLPGFAERLLANTPKARISPQARKLLVSTARGMLPEIKYYA